MSMDSFIEVFYHLNKILIATKHIADNNFVFYATWSKSLNFTDL